MSHKGKFKKVESTQKRLYGPRKLLICGYPEEERKIFLQMLEKIQMSNISVVFARSEDLENTLEEILALDHLVGFNQSSPMQRAVIMSGITQKELHNLMGSYKKTDLPNQLWATLTPYSEKWTLNDLLKELASEAKSMKNQAE